MGEPHDAPSADELVEAVQEWLERDVLPSADGRLRFHTRVAINVLGMVQREIELGPGHAQRHRERLDQLGVEDDTALAAAIRDRAMDHRLDELRALLSAAVDDKLAVANPKYLDD